MRGMCFPEAVGWERHHEFAGDPNGGAERSIENGTLVIDSLASVEIDDSYVHYKYDTGLLPTSASPFIAEWSMQVIEQHATWYDTNMGFHSGTHILALQLARGAVSSTFEGWSYPLDLSAMREFTLVSDGLRSYALRVDDVLIHEGQFTDVLYDTSERVWFGDTVNGARSLSRWDFVRFGALPESSSAMLILSGAAWCRCFRWCAVEGDTR